MPGRAGPSATFAFVLGVAGDEAADTGAERSPD